MFKNLRVRIKNYKIQPFLAFGWYLNAKFHIHKTMFNPVLKRNLIEDFSHQWKWIAGSLLGSGMVYLNLLGFVPLRNKGWFILTSMDEYQYFHHLEMISYSFFMNCPVTGGLLELKTNVFIRTAENQSGQDGKTWCLLSIENMAGMVIS